MKQGADPNSVVDQKGKTVIMEAAHRCDLSMVKALTQYGADIEAKDRKPGFNAILYACASGCTKIVKLLQKSGADIQSVSNDQSNGLMQAAYSNKYEIIQFLIDQELDINAQNDKGQTPLIYSLDNCLGEYSFMKFAQKEKLRKNKKKTVLELLKHWADVNLADKNGNSPLSYTVKQGCLDYTELLLKNGARPDSSKDNLLHAAENVSENKEALKALLIQYGAKNSPFTVSYNISIVCKECGKYVPMNGPYERVKCDYCLTETKLSEIDEDLWGDIFEYSTYKEQSYKLEATCKVDLKHSAPRCAKCDSKLDISDYNFGSKKAVICKKCAYKNNSFPAPDFLKEYTVNDLTPQ